ncbi:hypothetical protein FGO68_gene11613 [Halteria grandinella]|uniref:Uncharacterized protein n=1 Tax=Halteria grandinella TaxID=5974 RepID=A0A8J8P766_HALGN|nr:hypothetical protein FGO68_gene11613 [Halteria grandinella]
MIEPFHRKASDTLSAIMRDLNLSNSCFRILSIYKDVTVDNTLKLMEKCNSMVEARTMIYQVLKDLQKHESMVKDIKYLVDENLNESLDPLTISQIRKIAERLYGVTNTIKQSIIHLRDEYKLFARIAAMSNKIIVFDIKDLPYIGLSENRTKQAAHEAKEDHRSSNSKNVELKATPHQ